MKLVPRVSRRSKVIPAKLQVNLLLDPNVVQLIKDIGWWTLFKISYFPFTHKRFFSKLNGQGMERWNTVINHLIQAGFFHLSELEGIRRDTPKMSVLLEGKGKEGGW